MSNFQDYVKTVNTSIFSASGPISFIVLGAYDSKIGPHVKCLWFHRDKERKCSIHDDTIVNPSLSHIAPTKFLVNFILSTLLNGDQEPLQFDECLKSHPLSSSVDNSIKNRTIIMERHHIYLQSCVYMAPRIRPESEMNNNNINNSNKFTCLLPHCVCIAFSLDLYDKMSSWSLVINNFMSQHIPYLRIIHKKCGPEEILTNYNGLITHLLCVLSSLQTYSLDYNICMKKTFFCTSSSSGGDKIRREFLSAALMSHMITFGRSLVIGTDITMINTMIRTLALFVSPEKRHLCIELSEEEEFNFSSNMMVQGICKDRLPEMEYTFWSVVIGPYPLTVIYLNMERVLQTGTYTQHIWMQNIVHDKLLSKLYLLPKCPPLKLYYRDLNVRLESILKDGSFLGDLTRTFVHKIMNVSGCRRKFEVLEQFRENIIKKAKLLIIYTQTHAQHKNNGWKVSNNQLKDVCQLKKEGDFLIVLAVAESLSPGIYGVVQECPMGKVSDMIIMFNQL